MAKVLVLIWLGNEGRARYQRRPVLARADENNSADLNIIASRVRVQRALK